MIRSGQSRGCSNLETFTVAESAGLGRNVHWQLLNAGLFTDLFTQIFFLSLATATQLGVGLAVAARFEEVTQATGEGGVGILGDGFEGGHS